MTEFSMYTLPMMIRRTEEIQSLREKLRQFPVVAIIGPRQVGKTTLARILANTKATGGDYFDLENPEDLARLSDPMLALKSQKGLVIIDEVQRKQDLFPILRVLADDKRAKRRFLLLGSASPQLLQQSSESLAGRIIYHELQGFSLKEVGLNRFDRLWLRGGFPLAFLAGSADKSMEWRRSFIQTFLERDIPQLGIFVRTETLRRFWQMLAHYHGQRWNASEFGRSFGVADTTVRHYLDLLSSAFVIRQLSPWHENLSKRQVKAPKIYVMDSGLLHALLGIKNMTELMSHPKVGASWEGFISGEITRLLGAKRDECFHWATHAGAELDLFVVRGRHRLGFEIKRTTKPSMTASIHSALSDLKLTRLDVIHAGDHTFWLAKKVRAVAASGILKELVSL